MECDNSCKAFCKWVGKLPHHKNYVLPKEDYRALPECFNETFLGETVLGALQQFRGPFGAHVHEFEDRFELHRDFVNADEDPVGHLVKDAPEYLASILIALATGIASSQKQDKGKAFLAGGLTGAMALLAGKAVKMLTEDSAKEDGKAPRIN